MNTCATQTAGMEDSAENGPIVAAVSIPRILKMCKSPSRYGKRGYKSAHLAFFSRIMETHPTMHYDVGRVSIPAVFHPIEITM
jgi:hypothetical protein